MHGHHLQAQRNTNTRDTQKKRMREKVWDDFSLCLFPPSAFLSLSVFFIKFMRNKKKTTKVVLCVSLVESLFFLCAPFLGIWGESERRKRRRKERKKGSNDETFFGILR